MDRDSIKEKIDSVRGLATEDILMALGLERKRTVIDKVIPAAGFLAVGAAIGAGAALLLAPKSGRDMRRELKGSARELGRKVSESAEGMAEEVKHALLKSEPEESSTAANGARAERKPAQSAHK